MNLTENVLRDILRQAFQLGCISPAEEKEVVVSSLIEKVRESVAKDFTAEQESRKRISVKAS